MPRYLAYLFGTFIAVLLVAGPVEYALYEQGEIRNFHVVRRGVLYRSGQLSISGLQRIIHDYGIKTVITLRDATRLGDRRRISMRKNSASRKTSITSASRREAGGHPMARFPLKLGCVSSGP